MSTEIENPEPQPSDQQEMEVSTERPSQLSSIEKMDSELRFKIKQSFLNLKITVCVSLSVDEVAGLRDPVPYYVRDISFYGIHIVDRNEPPIKPIHLRG